MRPEELEALKQAISQPKQPMSWWEQFTSMLPIGQRNRDIELPSQYGQVDPRLNPSGDALLRAFAQSNDFTTGGLQPRRRPQGQ